MRRIAAFAFGLLLAFALTASAQVVVSGTHVLISGTHPVLTTPGSGGGGGLTIGQHTFVSTQFGSSVSTPATGSPVTTGSTFLVIATSGTTFAGGTIGDTFSNTYTQKISDLSFSGGNRYLNAWICQNCTGGASFQVGISPGGGSNTIVLEFIEIKGASAVSFDQVASTGNATQVGSALVPLNSVTTTAAPGMVISFLGFNVAATYSAPTNGFTLGDQTIDSGMSETLGWAYLPTSATGAYSTTLTSTTTNDAYASGTISFK